VHAGCDQNRKIETGLERGRWLSRKLRNTELLLSSCPAWPVWSPFVILLHEHSVSQFSQQPLTAFKTRFDFPDLCNTINVYKGQKHSVARISDDDFWGCSPLVMLLHQHRDSYFSHQPLTTSSLSPDAVVLTNATPLITKRGREHSSAKIEASDFESPLNEKILRSKIF
jgi:hypothetical protein